MYTWESLSDPPRKLSMYVLYVMLHAALSGLPLCKRGHTNITFLFGNSFLLSLLLTFSFYSNWYGCQPLLGTQNHPGPKVHTQANFLCRIHPSTCKENAGLRSFGVLKRSFGVLKRSFEILKRSFKNLKRSFTSFQAFK